MCLPGNSGTLCQGRKWLAAMTGRERTTGETVWWNLAEETGWRPFESLCLLGQHGLRAFWEARSKYVPPLHGLDELWSPHTIGEFLPFECIFWQFLKLATFFLLPALTWKLLYHSAHTSSCLLLTCSIFSLRTRKDTGYFPPCALEWLVLCKSWYSSPQCKRPMKNLS